MNWKTEVENMRFTEPKKSWREVGEYMLTVFPELKEQDDPIKKAIDKARTHIRRCDKYQEVKEEDFERSSLEYKKDGSIVSEKFITVRDATEMTPEFILDAHGLDPLLWELVAYKNNMWNTQVKGGYKQISYQSKVTAKPIVSSITFADVDRYLNEKKFKYDKPLTKPIQYDPNGQVLEIDLPDLHSGLLSWRKETGADYDVNIAKDRFFKCILDIKERCKNEKFKRIEFVTLGDLLHFDNEQQTTSKGTFQQADSRLAKIFDATQDMIIDGVTMLGNISPTRVTYIKGNHDGVTGYMLMRGAAKAFQGDANITFDTEPNPHKYLHFGKVLIGLTHGNMPKSNMAMWLQNAAKKEYGESQFVEIHAGHFHTEKTREKKAIDYYQTDDVGGIVIKYLPTISNSSYWEHEQGYPKGTKTMVSYIWNEETGLRTTWYSNV